MARNHQRSLMQVLEHKRQVEEQKQRELHVLSQQRHVVEDALRTLRQQAVGQLEAMTGADGATIDPAERTSALAYLDSVEGRIVQQRDLLLELESKVVASRDELIEVLKDRQMLERVQERRASRQEQEDQRREANEADDQTSARLSRRRAQEQGQGAS